MTQNDSQCRACLMAERDAPDFYYIFEEKSSTNCYLPDIIYHLTGFTVRIYYNISSKNNLQIISS